MLASLVRETVTQTRRRATSPLTGARQADIDRRLVAIESERDALNPDTAITVSTNVLRWRSLSPAALFPPVRLPLSSSVAANNNGAWAIAAAAAAAMQFVNLLSH